MSHRELREEGLNSFIDDLNQEIKPGIYASRDEILDEEMEKMLETVRAVKRIRLEQPGYPAEELEKKVLEFRPAVESRREKGTKSFFLFKGKLSRAAMAAVAAVFILVGFLGNLHEELYPGSKENIVQAMVQAYEELQGYQGIVEITSERQGQVDYQEKIEVTYQKPWKYAAVHYYNGVEVKNISDGNRLVSVFPGDITVDNVFPERELWRYHIGNQVWEVQDAREVKELGGEKLLGRETLVLEYRYSDYLHRMWVDKETRLPLRKELELYEGGDRLVVEFTRLEINPEIEPGIFSYPMDQGGDANLEILQIPQEDAGILEGTEEPIESFSVEEDLPGGAEGGVSYQEINRRGTLETVQAPIDLERFKESISGYHLITVGMLDQDLVFDYVLRFRGNSQKDFFDAYVSYSPRKFTLSSQSRLGTLAGGYVEIHPRAWNVMDLYLGESSVTRWLTEDWELFLVTNPGSELPLQALEKLTGAQVELKNRSWFEGEGFHFPVEKEGH